jgi:hypothetical protein
MAKRSKAQPTDTRRSVASTIDRLGGSSRSDLEPDAGKGGGSSLGSGTGSKKEELRRSLTLRGRKGER